MLVAACDSPPIGGGKLIGRWCLGLWLSCVVGNGLKIELYCAIPHAATKAFSPNSILFSMCSLM